MLTHCPSQNLNPHLVDRLSVRRDHGGPPNAVEQGTGGAMAFASQEGKGKHIIHWLQTYINKMALDRL